MRALPGAVLKGTKIKFRTPSEVTEIHQPVAPLHVPFAISWADEERDTSAWLGNELQNEAFEKLYALEKMCLHPGARLLYQILASCRRVIIFIICAQSFSLTELCTNISIRTILLMRRSLIT
jgi:alpha-amylase/alpha-mannosidase (GH57 family)